MSFAEGTSVPVERSKAEIESMLMRYGADQFISGWGVAEARIQFRAEGRIVRFVLPIPANDETRFAQHPRYASKRRSDADARKAWEAELRRLWRALALVVKAKLEGGAEWHRRVRRGIHGAYCDAGWQDGGRACAADDCVGLYVGQGARAAAGMVTRARRSRARERGAVVALCEVARGLLGDGDGAAAGTQQRGSGAVGEGAGWV